jgi:hypothetical protein
MVEPLRHRQTKGAATDMFYLMPPRHISTLHQTDVLSESRMREICLSGCVSSEGWHVQQETNLPG